MLRKIKINFSIVAAVIAITAAFAFTPSTRLDVVYYFNGSDSDDIKTAGNWSQTMIPTDCQQFADLPCALTLPDQVSLNSYLSTHTEQEITDASEGRRPE